MSHRARGNGTDYRYDDTAGNGTCSYVIDTGIQVDHADFGGRAEWLQNFSGDGVDRDGGGHGTFVAGIIGSGTWGVAKKTRLLALKVFDNSGATTESAVLAAMDFAADDHPTRNCPAGVTVNLSLAGGRSQATNDAVDALVESGAFVAVAAGNSADDAGNWSPASAAKACTVGSTGRSDAISGFSNFGSVVDIFAPGEDITSTAVGDSNNEQVSFCRYCCCCNFYPLICFCFFVVWGGEALCQPSCLTAAPGRKQVEISLSLSKLPGYEKNANGGDSFSADDGVRHLGLLAPHRRAGGVPDGA